MSVSVCVCVCVCMCVCVHVFCTHLPIVNDYITFIDISTDISILIQSLIQVFVFIDNASDYNQRAKCPDMFTGTAPWAAAAQ